MIMAVVVVLLEFEADSVSSSGCVEFASTPQWWWICWYPKMVMDLLVS